MPFSLLHPALFGFGIAAVSIPIILHLLKRKRRPISWGAMRFLEQAYRKRRRILTIEQLILLLLRCLLLVCIALGVGSLLLGSGLTKARPTTMVIVIDQSIGSALEAAGNTSLQRNKDFALRALSRLDQSKGDRAMLIAAGSPALGLVIPESSDINAVRLMIENLSPTDSRLDLPGALALARSLTQSPDQPTKSVLILAASGRGMGSMTLDTVTNQGDRATTPQRFDRVLVRTPETEPITNISIISAANTRSLVTRAGPALPMGVRINLLRSGKHNASDQTTILRTLDGRGNTIGSQSIQWQPGQTNMQAIVPINTDSLESMGARTAIIKVLIDDDANSRDNARLITFATRTNIRVGVIHHTKNILGANPNSSLQISASRWVRAALAPGGNKTMGISIVDIEATRAGAMLNTDLDAAIILSPSSLDDSAWDRIRDLHKAGTLVIVTPDAHSDSLDWIDHVDAMTGDLITQSLTASGRIMRDHQTPLSIAPDQQADALGLLLGIAPELDELSASVLISRSLDLRPSNNNAIALLEDGSALAIEQLASDGRGVLVMFACPLNLESTNLMARAMFVPLLQEIVRQGVGIGSSMPTINAGTRAPFEPWIATSQRVSFEQGTTPSNMVAGEYNTTAGILAQLDSQGTTRQLVIINPDASGSNADPADLETLSQATQAHATTNQITWIDDPIAATSPDTLKNTRDDLIEFESSQTGVSIALWMLMMACILAIIETALARLFTARLFETPIKEGQI